MFCVSLNSQLIFHWKSSGEKNGSLSRHSMCLPLMSAMRVLMWTRIGQGCHSVVNRASAARDLADNAPFAAAVRASPPVEVSVRAELHLSGSVTCVAMFRFGA